jgi:hypothetical protein
MISQLFRLDRKEQTTSPEGSYVYAALTFGPVNCVTNPFALVYVPRASLVISPIGL